MYREIDQELYTYHQTYNRSVTQLVLSRRHSRSLLSSEPNMKCSLVLVDDTDTELLESE